MGEKRDPVPVGRGAAHLSCPAVSQSWRWTLKVFPVVVPLDAVYTWGERNNTSLVTSNNTIQPHGKPKPPEWPQSWSDTMNIITSIQVAFIAASGAPNILVTERKTSIILLKTETDRMLAES